MIFGKETKEGSNFFSDRFADTFSRQLNAMASDKAKKNYYSYVSELCRHCQKDFLDLNENDVISYFNSLSDKSANTRRTRFSAFRSVAKHTDKALGTPTIHNFYDIPNVNLPEMNYTMADLPDLKNVNTVFDSLKPDDSFKDYQLLTIIQLALETGLTSTAICALTYDNFRCDDPSGLPLIHYDAVSLGTDELGNEKQSIPRNIPISADLAQKINRCGSINAKRKSCGTVFRNDYGDALSERTLEINLKNACEKAGLSDDRKAENKSFTIRDLRILATAHMKAGGADNEALARQLDVSEVWFNRINDVAHELKHAAGNYNHLKVVW